MKKHFTANVKIVQQGRGSQGRLVLEKGEKTIRRKPNPIGYQPIEQEER
jgi:hypothetical protein